MVSNICTTSPRVDVTPFPDLSCPFRAVCPVSNPSKGLNPYLAGLQAGEGAVQHHTGQVQEGQHDQGGETAGGVRGGQGGPRLHPLCDPAPHRPRPNRPRLQEVHQRPHRSGCWCVTAPAALCTSLCHVPEVPAPRLQDYCTVSG